MFAVSIHLVVVMLSSPLTFAISIHRCDRDCQAPGRLDIESQLG